MNFYKFILTFSLCCCVLSTFSQALLDFPCYSVSSGELPNVLFVFDPTIDRWYEVGVTGGTSIEAIAFDPVNDIMYAVDAGTFGTIDVKTALFTPIGEVGIGNGENGFIELNSVKGLTYDPINEIMYATHNVKGFGTGTNDLLFQIDVATGKVIPGAMLNANNIPVDYSIIPEIFDGEIGADVYDAPDIAYNSYTGQLFATQNQGNSRVTITELNPANGQLEAVIYSSPGNDVQGLGISYLGELYGTIGNNGATPIDINTFIFIDIRAATKEILTFIDQNNQYTDFEAFDCFTAYVDLALKMEVKPNTQQPVNIGETVSFLITIYNQGKFLNTDISITNYIPNGLILSDTSWLDLGNGTATYTGSQLIEPNTSVKIPVSYIVDSNFTGASITNTAEIESSFNRDITDVWGNPILLPDWDSNPDNINNETNIIDDNINGKGPNSIQPDDEDDHDIAILQVNSLLAELSIVPELCNRSASGSMQVVILTDGTPPFNFVWENANGLFIDESTSYNLINAIYNQPSGEYVVTITDQLNRKSIFEVTVPLLSNINGNVDCDNPCPSYLVTSNGAISGQYQAKEIIDIKGSVEKSATAVFDICQ